MNKRHYYWAKYDTAQQCPTSSIYFMTYFRRLFVTAVSVVLYPLIISRQPSVAITDHLLITRQ